jgi:hypothetical protein
MLRADTLESLVESVSGVSLIAITIIISLIV